MEIDLEGKFVVLEYDAIDVDPGPALMIYQVKNQNLEIAYNPKGKVVCLDMGACESARDYLVQEDVEEVYCPKEIIGMPDSILGLELYFDGRIWGNFRALGKHYWEDFFGKVDIEFKEFHPRPVKNGDKLLWNLV